MSEGLPEEFEESLDVGEEELEEPLFLKIALRRTRKGMIDCFGLALR